MQFINNYRGIAILLIVLIHAIGTINNNDSAILYAIGLLLDNSTILFVVVAGYLFSSLSFKFNYRQYLTHKFRVIIIPYFFVSIPAVLIYMTGLKTNHYWIDMDWFHSLTLINQYLYFMFSGAHLVTLWFIPMIIPFYLLSPVILYIRNKNFLEIFFVICLIPALWFGRPEFSENNLIWSVYFFPAYLLGMILCLRPRIYELLVAYCGPILLSFMAIYLASNWFSPFSTSVDLLWKMSLSIILIACSKRYLAKKNRWLNMFARLSFYLFFVHGYFIGVIRILYRQYFNTEVTGILAASASFTVTIICSLLTFVMIKLILKDKSKIFVGL